MLTKRAILRTFIFLLFIQIQFGVQAQLLNHYWSQSYNSISSLLSGAVVAGDAGPSSIYYNPANISELTHGTNLSVAASFLTLNYYANNNALGNGIDLSTTNFYVQPQFFSMSFNSPDNKISFEIATFTRIRERLSISYGNSEYGNFTEANTITERYTNTYHYKNDYDDSWLGIGTAYSVTDDFSVGLSFLISLSSLNYYFYLSAILDPISDSIESISGDVSYFVAENSYLESVKFTNIRFVSKIGLSYKTGKWSFGLNFTTPALNILTTGKRAEREQKELYSIVGFEETHANYLIYDVQSDDQIKANYKLPFSVALGIIYNLARKSQRFYVTIEYFAGLKPYKMIDASVNDRITSKDIYDQMENKDWLSFAYGASPILNLALGYQWLIKKNLLVMMGFRTDFNSANNYELEELSSYNRIKTTDYNIYHATGGVQFHFKKHLLVAGTQLSFGYKENQEQVANFSDTDNIDLENPLPLFGQREKVMDTYYFSISVFLGATLNFEKKEKVPQD